MENNGFYIEGGNVETMDPHVYNGQGGETWEKSNRSITAGRSILLGEREDRPGGAGGRRNDARRAREAGDAGSGGDDHPRRSVTGARDAHRSGTPCATCGPLGWAPGCGRARLPDARALPPCPRRYWVEREPVSVRRRAAPRLGACGYISKICRKKMKSVF